MLEIWQKSFVSTILIATILILIAHISGHFLENLPLRKQMARGILAGVRVVSIFSAIAILLFLPLNMMREANNTIVSETKYTIVAASETEDSNQLELTIEDANGETTTITTRISDLEIAEKGDFFIVTEYETHTKSYTIVYEEESEYADVFDAFWMRQEIMR